MLKKQNATLIYKKTTTNNKELKTICYLCYNKSSDANEKITENQCCKIARQS